MAKYIPQWLLFYQVYLSRQHKTFNRGIYLFILNVLSMNMIIVLDYFQYKTNLYLVKLKVNYYNHFLLIYLHHILTKLPSVFSFNL